MRVLIYTHGTRGDVQPFAALALALNAAGHQAVLSAPAGATGLAEPHGLRFAPLHDGPITLMRDPLIQQAIDTNYSGLRGKTLAIKVMRESKRLMAPVLEDMAAVATEHGADLVVHQPNLPGHVIAESLGVPAVLACLQPMWVPTRSFTNPMLPIQLPAALNRLSYLPSRLALRAFKRVTDTWRHDTLGLPRRRGSHNPLRRPNRSPAVVLQAISRHLLPANLDYPDQVHTTGFWTMPATPDWQPPPELADFLAAGTPPVYIGFGSMAGSDPDRKSRLIADAVRLAGVRAVVVAGWGGIQPNGLGTDVHYLAQAPFDWLLPRMSAIVHHGGSGTTGAALAAGRPQVVCPFVADQPFFARRMHALGVAPPPQPQRRLTADNLAEAIHHTLTSDAMTRRAEQLGRRIRTENGARDAVHILDSLT